jgi:hypothetical protein
MNGSNIGGATPPNVPIPSVAYRITLGTMLVAGLSVVAVSCREMVVAGATYQWFGLAALAVVTSLFPLKIPGLNSRVSISDIFVFSNLVLFGPAAGAVTAALDAFTASMRLRASPRKGLYVLFNVAAMPLAAYLAGLAFFGLQGRGRLIDTADVDCGMSFLPIVFLAIGYHILNTGSVAIMVAFEKRGNVLRTWWDGFGWIMIEYLTCSCIALLIAANIHALNAQVWIATMLSLAVIYLTSRSYLDKIGRLAAPTAAAPATTGMA